MRLERHGGNSSNDADAMSQVIRFDQFHPVEKSKFLVALQLAAFDSGRFEVSKMEISPPMMPGGVTALVTVKLAASAIAFSYEDAAGSSWISGFEDDLRAGRFGGSSAAAMAQETIDPGDLPDQRF